MTTEAQAAALIGAPTAYIDEVTDTANAGTVFVGTDGITYWSDDGTVYVLLPPAGVVGSMMDPAARFPLGAPADPDPLPTGWIDDERLLALEAEAAALEALGADDALSTSPVGLAALADAYAAVQYLIEWRTIQLRAAWFAAEAE